MIGWLRGRLLAQGPDGELLVDVGGVGYRVTVAPSVQAAVGGPGDEVEVHVHTHVREDALVLYGFASLTERRCFEILLAAHGVGPSLALAVLGTLGADGLVRAVADEDVDALCAVPGVGRKTAARLVIDVQAKLHGAALAGGVPGGTAVVAVAADGRDDVRAALAELGYGPDEVRHALAAIDGAEGPVEDLLRQALRQLAAAR